MTVAIDRVLTGVDGSPEAHQALEWAMVIARCCDAELLVVHAVGLLTHLGDGPAMPTQSHLVEVRATFEREWCSVLATSTIPHRLLLRNGPPVLALLEVADHEGVDLIVVGRHGAGRGPGSLLGSTSHQLAEGSHVPVVIVPPTTTG